MRFALLLLLCLVAPASNAEGLMDRISNLAISKQPDFLKPDDAFQIDVKVRDAHTLQANFKVTPTYYLYRDKITFATKDQTVKITSVSLPKGEIKHDQTFGDTEVFHQSFQGLITLTRSGNAATRIALDAVYQGCSEEGLCYPPITKTVYVSLPAVTTGQLANRQAVLGRQFLADHFLLFWCRTAAITDTVRVPDDSYSVGHHRRPRP
jgi:thiol:disulfide interchange protein DsbD